MPETLAILTALLIGTVSLYAYYQVYQHSLSPHPGPFLAKLTNLWRFSHLLRGRQHEVDAELHKRYGPVVRDGPDSLLIADLEAFKTIYGFETSVEKGDFYKTMSNRNPARPNAFAATTEVLHREARKKIVTPLSPKVVEQYEETVDGSVAVLLRLIEQHLEGNEKGIVNIGHLLDLFSFDAVLHVIYGKSIGLLAAGRDEGGILKAKAAIWIFAIGIGLIPWLTKLIPTTPTDMEKSRLSKPKPKRNKPATGLAIPAEWSQQVLSEATKDPENHPPSVLRNLLLVDDNDNRKADLENIRYECFNALFAGTSSTAISILAVLYRLGSQPKWQDKVCAEIKAARNPIPQLPAFQAVLKETLRLHPPFPSPFERIIGPGGENDIPNLGPIPRGTRVWSNWYVICRDQSIFGQDFDAVEWQPSRWIESSPEQLKVMEDMYCVFGRGRRQCVGKNLAWMVVEKTVAAILTNWNIRCENGALKGKNYFEMQYEKLDMVFESR